MPLGLTLTRRAGPRILSEMIDINGEAFLDVQEAAERLGVKRETLYAYVSRGLLRSFRQGVRRRRLYMLRDVESLLSLRPGAGEPPAVSAAASVAPLADLPPAPADAGESDLPPASDWVTER